MTEPRELTYLVPVDVLAAVENAVAALETYSPVVTEALRQLDRATTLARRPTTNGSSSSSRSASTVAGMRPTGWSPPSTCLARSRPPT